MGSDHDEEMGHSGALGGGGDVPGPGLLRRVNALEHGVLNRASLRPPETEVGEQGGHRKRGRAKEQKALNRASLRLPEAEVGQQGLEGPQSREGLEGPQGIEGRKEGNRNGARLAPGGCLLLAA